MIKVPAVPCVSGAHKPIKALNPQIETCEICGHATLIHEAGRCYGCVQ